MDEISQMHVVPFAPMIENHFLLMQDNARPHIDYLVEVNIEKLDWPARSPNLNPIEHAWGFLKRTMKGRHSVPETLNALRIAIVEE